MIFFITNPIIKRNQMALGNRLKAARKAAKMSQATLAKLAGVSQGLISDIENNVYTTSVHVPKLAHVLGVDAIYLSEGISKWKVVSVSKDETDESIKLVGFVNTDKSIRIPILAATASAGKSSNAVESERVIEVLSVNKDWAERVLRPASGTNNLGFIHAIGDSMHPTFNDGDILMVDTGDTTVTADKIYVIEAHERLFIKRVRQRIDGMFEISSDNPAVKTVDVLTADQPVKIKGRVIWVFNGRKI